MKKTQSEEGIKTHPQLVIAGVLVFLVIGILAWFYISKVHGVSSNNQLNQTTKTNHPKAKPSTDPKLIAVPASLRGTWYYYSNVRGRQSLEKIKLTSHMVRNSMVFDSRQITKKYRHPAVNKDLHQLQNQYPNALEGVVKKKGNSESLLVYDLLDREKARELFYLKDKVLQIVSDGKITKAYATSQQAKKHLPKNSTLAEEDDALDAIFY